MAARPESGFLNINKAADWTSNDVVRVTKKIAGVRKVGHGGTLDPGAEGVLPLCLGQATRLAGMLLHGSKEYRLHVRLGSATDTCDAAGEVVAEAPYGHVKRADAEAWLGRMTGVIKQVPPMYSALKHKGQRLYKLAREGVEVERPPRDVEVRSAVLLEFEPPDIAIRVECGGGFYARSYAADMGGALGSAAHLAGLVRLRTGIFRLEDARTIEELKALAAEGRLGDALLPLEHVLEHIPRVTVPPPVLEMIINGVAVRNLGSGAGELRDGALARVHDGEGRLAAIMAYSAEKRIWKPDKVFAAR